MRVGKVVSFSLFFPLVSRGFGPSVCGGPESLSAFDPKEPAASFM